MDKFRYFFEKEGKFNWESLKVVSIIVAVLGVMINISSYKGDMENASKNRVNETIAKMQINDLENFKSATREYSKYALELRYEQENKKETGNKLTETRLEYRKAYMKVISSIDYSNKHAKQIQKNLREMEEQLRSNANGTNVTFMIKDDIMKNYSKEELRLIEEKIK